MPEIVQKWFFADQERNTHRVW